jgi:hypothetical protein
MRLPHRTRWFLYSLLSMFAPCGIFAQKIPASSESRILVKTSETTVPLLSALAITAPVMCDGEGGAYMRLTTPSSLGPLVGIAPDGNSRTLFDTDKIADLHVLDVASHFVSGSDVYVLVVAGEPHGKRKMKTSTGETIDVPMFDSKYFVARFDLQGRYSGSRQLDIEGDFSPAQFAVFPHDGGYLVSGSSDHFRRPRIAVFRSDGAFFKDVELPKDVHEKQNQDDQDPLTLPVNAPAGSGNGLLVQLSSARLISDSTSGSMLFFRQTAGYPIYRIDPSGAVTMVSLKLPKGTTFRDLRTVNGKWVVATEESANTTNQHSYQMYAVDPSTGEVLTRYELPSGLGFGFACTDGLHFSFLRGMDRNISVVNMIATSEEAPDQKQIH